MAYQIEKREAGNHYNELHGYCYELKIEGQEPRFFGTYEQAKAFAEKTETQKRQRNTAARARYSAMRSLGMKRTPYGWE